MAGPDDRMEDMIYEGPMYRPRRREGGIPQSPAAAQGEGSFRGSIRGEDEISRRLNFLHSRGAYALEGRRIWRERERAMAHESRAAQGRRGLSRIHDSNAGDNASSTIETCAGFAKHQSHVGSSIQIKHWQLRDLVRCPFARDDVFVIKGFAVYRYDISQQKVVDRYGFLFEPTCFGFGDSFVGVAGEISEYAVQSVSSTPSQFFGGQRTDTSLFQHYGALETGGHVNNAIKITEDIDGRLSAWLCNNSGHLMVMSGVDEEGELELSEKSSIFCPVSINHCAVSKHERTLVYVGDSEEVFVSRATPTGYRTCCTFREATDAGMSCDWDSSGATFAVASQDGLVCVWDRRHRNAVARIPCRSAARCVKFSPQPLDLLAFTEHRNHLHLVDCRMWESRQTIRAGNGGGDIDIAGFDWSPCGSTLYVGTEDAMDILQINCGSRTSFPYAKLA
jgi:WD40 repeat protein